MDVYNVHIIMNMLTCMHLLKSGCCEYGLSNVLDSMTVCISITTITIKVRV